MFQIPETYFSVQEQTTLFLFAALLGLPLGLFYDGFRILRVLFRHPVVLVVLEDLLFCFGCAVTLAAFTSAACRGEFRLFYPVGMLLGSILWRLCVGNVLLQGVRKSTETIHRIFYKMFHPLSVIFARISCEIKQENRQILQNLKKQKKVRRIPLIVPHHLLYNKRKKQEVNQNVRCGKKKTSAIIQKKTTPKRCRTVRSANGRKRKKQKVSV